MPAHDWFIVLVTAGILLSLPVLFLARRRALHAPTTWPARPLDTAEIQYVKTWRRLSITGFILALVGWLAWTALLAFAGGDSSFGAWVWGVSMIAVAAVAFYVQYTPRCPRCQYRLGHQTRLGMPARCERCGVALK